MEYGSNGHPGNQRFYTPNLGSRKNRERGARENALPNILWKASGVTTRPTSGLRLTVTHVDDPYAGHRMRAQDTRDALTRPPQHTSARLTHSDPAGQALHYMRTSTQHFPRRSSLKDTRLLSRPQQLSSVPSTPPAPKATRTMLPPLAAPAAEPALTEVSDHSSEHPSTSNGDGSSSALEDSEEEIYSDDEGGVQSPPSRPGFESEEERSTQIFDVPFHPSPSPTATFPATLLQDHMQFNMEKFAATVQPSGLNARVNNIVRAFSIHGPLDRALLSQALDTVASLHPVLAAKFQRHNNKLYMQAPPGRISVSLESPIVGHEKPDTLIINARRKLFSLSMHRDLVSGTGSHDERRAEGEGSVSVVSVESSRNSEDGCEKDTARQKPISFLPSSSKKSVTFGDVTAIWQGPPDAKPHHLQPLQAPRSSIEQHKILIRARLVRESVHDSTLVLSFPRIICDYWSSCLFVQQLADVYAKLEKSSTHRPSLAAKRIEAKRRELTGKYGRQERLPHPRAHAGVRESGAGRLQMAGAYRPVIPARLSFQQVAHRERQLLKFLSKEKLWVFWESMITATIQRQRGPNRVKVVPPVRIPSGLGEKVARVRPQTSRLRPLTGRVRPQTGRKMVGDDRDSLAGPKTEFHFIKFEEEVCTAFRMAFPEEHQASVREEELLCLLCLGAYVLLLGRCCRGWGEEEVRGRGRGDGASGPLVSDSSSGVVAPLVLAGSRTVRDPLHHYKMDGGPRQGGRGPVVIPAVEGSSPRRTRRAGLGGKLDLGSFLLGVEVSLRHMHPKITQGLFGPLTNDVGIRVNLGSCETFVDLMLALGRSLQSARNHHHFPFTTVTDELGVPAGLPVRFSYLYRSDIFQLSDPTQFYFPETAVGVKGHGLARFGSSCYLSPLCTKLEDSRHLELCLWESYDGDHVGGVVLFQPHLLRRDLVEALARELSQLMATIAQDPCLPLPHLASLISPPFSSTRSRRTTAGRH